MTAKTKSAAKRKAVGAKSKRPKLALQEQIDLLAGLTAKLAQRVSALECPSPLLLDIEKKVTELEKLKKLLIPVLDKTRVDFVSLEHWGERPVISDEEMLGIPEPAPAAPPAAQSGVSPSAPADLASDPNTIAMHDLRKP